MKYWGYRPESWTFWIVLATVTVMLWAIFYIYWKWIEIAYKGLIYNVRRRDFYLKKAEIICYHSSKELACEVCPCEKVSVYLGGGEHRMTAMADLKTVASEEFRVYVMAHLKAEWSNE